MLVEQAKNIATTKDSTMITVNIVVIIEVADSDACFICFEKNLVRLYARTQTKMISDVQVAVKHETEYLVKIMHRKWNI